MQQEGQFNGNGAQIIVHASLADVPDSNIKDLDLNQGDTITNVVVNICMTYNVFGVTFFAWQLMLEHPLLASAIECAVELHIMSISHPTNQSSSIKNPGIWLLWYYTKPPLVIEFQVLDQSAYPCSPWSCKPLQTLQREGILNSSLMWKLVKRSQKHLCSFFVCRGLQLQGLYELGLRKEQ